MHELLVVGIRTISVVVVIVVIVIPKGRFALAAVKTGRDDSVSLADTLKLDCGIRIIWVLVWMCAQCDLAMT